MNEKSFEMDGDEKRGEKLFKARCAQCHTYQKNQPHKTGPNLYGLFGRETGQCEGYMYSSANKNASIVWNEQTLFDYLEDPQKYIPRTKMVLRGFKGIQERKDVIAFLKKVTI